MYETDMYEGMIAETTSYSGHNGDLINAYLARPLGPGPYPGMVIIHHMPGWDEWYREAARKFAHYGYITISPNLYFRAGHGTPEDVTAKVRAEGGVADEQVMGDLDGAIKWLRAQANLNGKVGIFGTCSGGRQAYLAACRLKGLDAAIDCWGGRVVMEPDQLTDKYPVAPLDYTADLSCPLLGLFGEEDRSPTPEQVAIQEAELKKHGKDYEFHMYPDAGHGFFYYNRPNYRWEQTNDGWEKIFDFLGRHLA
ncbi:MAG: dienelactone hydrolase family protein [Anaerolineales bacterium]|nr:dienelactone hydrolase family protein [Anaerolineales bacterium]